MYHVTIELRILRDLTSVVRREPEPRVTTKRGLGFIIADVSGAIVSERQNLS